MAFSPALSGVAGVPEPPQAVNITTIIMAIRALVGDNTHKIWGGGDSHFGFLSGFGFIFSL